MEQRVRRVKPTVSVQDTVMVVTASGVGVEEEKRKVISVRKFETDVAFVRVGAGVTKSTAPYESIRIDVAITVPCYVEEIEAVQRRTELLVSDMLEESIANYIGEN